MSLQTVDSSKAGLTLSYRKRYWNQRRRLMLPPAQYKDRHSEIEYDDLECLKPPDEKTSDEVLIELTGFFITRFDIALL